MFSLTMVHVLSIIFHYSYLGGGAIGQKLAFTLVMHCCNYATQNIIPLEGKAENVSIKDIMHPNFIFIIAAETSMM